MNYIIIDFEYNQAFDFEHGEKGDSIKDCPFEIIQIGAVKLDSNLKKIDSLNLFVKPILYERMHPFVSKMTNISTGFLKSQKDFIEVYPKFLEFLGNREPFLCFWGSNDLKELYKNISYHKLDFSNLPEKYIDVQKLTSKFLKQPSGKYIGLRNAVEALDINLDGDFHNALHDAKYTAEVFVSVKKSKSRFEKLNLNFLKEKTKEEKTLGFDAEALYRVSEGFFGRKLSRKEKNIIRKIYKMGRSKHFDFKN